MTLSTRRARRPGPSVRVRVKEYAEGRSRRREDRLATEEPLEVRLAWPGHPAERVAVTMRTPGHDFELAVGLLHAEGVVVPSALDTVAYCTDVQLAPEQEFNVVTVTLDAPPPRLPGGRGATVTAAASACGVCGADSIDEVVALGSVVTPAGEAAPLPPELLTALPARMREAQRVFDSTGGLHAAALFDGSGELLLLREDVGRHNAVDKVVGARVLAGKPPAVPLMCVSGRIGFEIVQKAVAAGVGVVAAIGAPSSLAVQLAEGAGLGVVGFLSAKRFVVYAGGDRIAG
ncbi:formate dehydrogenase accessory sulfurtransferase FdhD [Nocardioides caldifontis]|uniref:formate dehydrogenase accessory sulfurtransferase FdhD n=1 Tax=Nocardioides caldifontis TaxID=2588938 RepID=UPI001EEFA880|nr:formate dehydrogenase accessory sulfurtransferase FdhD [Nocardioides caldifontis]